MHETSLLFIHFSFSNFFTSLLYRIPDNRYHFELKCPLFGVRRILCARVCVFGDFDLTVSKLLAKVYPGMEFKAVHQLDYATSGVLWCVTTWSACLLKSRHYYTI
jgi:hypothetical protein